MFTGLIEEVGTVAALRAPRGGQLQRMELKADLVLEDAAVGDSIDINGACHTVVELLAGEGFAVESVAETLARTTMGQLRAGDRVNLERSLRPTDRLGGHLVLGHVDGVGTVRRFEAVSGGGGGVREVAPPAELSRYIAFKGSIAVDGISLTVADLLDESFTIAIIPHTLQHTNLSQVRPGSRVNLEVDVLARYVERLMTGGNSRHNPPPAGLSVESLRDLGP